MDYKERMAAEIAAELSKHGRNVPIAVAAALLGKTPVYVREGIAEGTLPIGSYVDLNGKRAFNVPPLRLMAYLMGGEGNAEMCVLRETV